MAQLIAMGAYFYQAAVALGVLIAVSHLLPASDYTVYSFFVAITQFGAIAGFEWIRFACSRFYPGPSPQSEEAERQAMRFGSAVSAAVCVALGLLAWMCGLPADIALLGTLVAILQGVSDLHLSMLRFSLQFNAFSILQSVRATILALATLLGAVIGGHVLWATGGLFAGYLVYWAVALVHVGGFGGRLVRPDVSLIRKHLVYGSVSAGASVAGLAAPILLKAIMTAVLGAQAAAGALLAIDLLQRPFIMMVAAVQGTCYPAIVALYDHPPLGATFRSRLGQYYALLTGLTLLTAAGLVALLGPAAASVIATDLQPGFLRAAPLVIAIAVFRSLIQFMLPTPAHLGRRLPAILMLAVFDCVLLNAGALLALGLFGGSDRMLLAGATAGAALATLPGLAILRSLPFALPWRPLLLALGGLGIAAASARVDEPYSVATLIAFAGAAACGVPALWLLTRDMRRGRAGRAGGADITLDVVSPARNQG